MHKEVGRDSFGGRKVLAELHPMHNGSESWRETNVDPVSPEPVGRPFNDCEDNAPAVRSGATVLVCSDVELVMDGLVEDVSFAPDGLTGTQTHACSTQRDTMISTPLSTALMARLAAAVYLVSSRVLH
ncbi:hypothetical protein GB937_009318 [Aspergillus fischeri]|nr:hypothetical protein GB937_009318 [Aspergillus fischeri]